MAFPPKWHSILGCRVLDGSDSIMTLYEAFRERRGVGLDRRQPGTLHMVCHSSPINVKLYGSGTHICSTTSSHRIPRTRKLSPSLYYRLDMRLRVLVLIDSR